MLALRRSLAIWVSSVFMMLFLSASAVGMPSMASMASIIEEPATASARAGADQQLVLHLDGNADLLVVHRALAKLRAKGQVGRTLFSSAVSIYVEGSADVVAELEGISGVAKVTLRNLAHPGSSLPSASSRGASQLAERWLRLDSGQPVEQMWPQILKSLNRWQAKGTVSEFERVGLDLIRVVIASDGISELETLSGVLEISDAPLTEARQGGKTLVEKGGVSADSAQRGQSADESQRVATTYRPYWLVLKPTGSAEGPLPGLLKELGRLQATGVVREFERTLKDNSHNILKVIATVEAEEALHKLPTVLDVASVAPRSLSLSKGRDDGLSEEAPARRQAEGGTLSRSLLTTTPTPTPTAVGGGVPPATPTVTRTPVGGSPPQPTPVGGGPPPPTPTPWVGGGGGGDSSIAGTVTAPDGTPLEGVEVIAFQYYEGWDYWEWMNGAVTDANGEYTVSDLPSGSYRVGFFDGNGSYLEEFYDDAHEIESATDVVVAAAEAISDIDAQLDDGGHITGTVTDENGNPLAEVGVEVYQYDQMYDYWFPVSYNVTDANGQYDVGRLRTGSARVGFFDWEGGHLPEFYDDAADVESASDVAVTIGESTTGIDAQLADGAHITGTVTDQNGNPLAEVAVDVYQYHEMYRDWYPINAGISDASGQYDVGGLRGGTYRVRFYDWMGRNLPEYYDDAADLESATDISVASGETTTGIDAQLADGGHITGTVTDENGNPLAEVGVEVYQREQMYGYWYPVNGGMTDASGQYDVAGLTSGTYRVGFYDWMGGNLPEFYDDAPDLDSATDISVTLGESTTGIDAQLADGGHITGTVTDENGDPLAEVGVEVYQYHEMYGYWEPINYGNTNASGEYDVGGLRSGTYRVGFYDWMGGNLPEFYNDAPDLENATDISVTSGETTTGIDAQLADGGHITGTVTDQNGDPLPEVGVEVYQYDEMYDYWEPMNYGHTDASGQYDVAGLRSGTYRVGFHDWMGGHLPEFYNDAPDLESATDISVTSSETTTGIDAQLADGGHITGTVSDENGNPLSEVAVEVYQYHEMYGYWESINYGHTDASGQYDVAGLRSGTYRVGFYDWRGRYLPEFYDDAADLESATDISVTSGETTASIDAQLDDGGHITGTVSDENGNPLPEVAVEVYQYDQRYNYWYPINYGHTNASGEYDVAGLRSGTYRVGFYDWMGGHLPEFYNDAPDVESATDILVTDGETTANIDANLSQGGQIAGVVTDPDGNPLSDVSVEVLQYQEADDYWQWVNYGHTDSNGQYEIAGLRSGTYRVGFFHWGGRYLPEFYNDAADVESGTDIVVTQGETTSDIDVSLSDGGHITGTITDPEGNLLPEVAVEVYHYDQTYGHWFPVNYALTDSTGKYDVSGLMSGTYRVAFFDWQGRYLPEYYDNAADLESATDVPVTAEQTTEGINASLSEGGHITGSITNGDGNPVRDIAVEVYQYHETQQVWLSIHYGHTDGSGRYDVGGLQSGTYRVGFFDWQSRYVSEFYSDAPDLESATDIAVTEAETTSGIDAQLGEGGHITGTVSAPDGSALPYVSIEVHRLDSNGQWVWAGWGETNFNGHYDVSGLNTGTYRIGFFDWASGYLPEFYNDAPDLESATDISVTEGQTTEGVDVQLAEGGHITGVVTSADGDTLPYTSIEVYRRDANGEWEWAGWADSSFDGSYDVAGLPTGNYRVGFLNWEGRYANEYYDNAPDLESAIDVAVTAGQTTEGIDALLEVGGTITGQISAPDGSTLFDVSVEVYRLDANDNWQIAGWGYTNPDGQYEVNGLASGTYRVAFHTWGMTYFTKYYSDASDLASATDVSVTQGETTSEIDVTLEEGGHITGTVTREESSGRFVAGGDNQLANVQIEAYRQNGDGEWEWAGWGMTDGNGQYDIAGLATGTYRVGFLEPFGFYAYEYYDDAADLESATDIAVTAGETTPNIDAALGDPADAVADATSQSGSVVVDPQTGEITVVQQNGNESDVTVSKVVTCSDDSSPSDVTLMVGDNSYPMSATENSNEYSATIPAAQVVDGAEIKVTKVCNNNSDEETIGQIQLFDPSGYITDATTGDPVVGANVTLYKVPGWQARTGAGENNTPNTCQSNLSKAANDPWSQVAPTHLGVIAATDSGEIDPATNPLVTDAEGYYGWDVAAGCWYVVVEAAGYQELISPVVGVPPEVTDLNLALTPTDTPLLPSVQFSAATYQVNENQDAATITISLLTPPSEAVTVEYNTTNQTATAGEDYTATSGTITISAGETVKTFNVTIHNDDAAEENETITLTLSNPNKAKLGTTNQATLTIMDDDGADPNNPEDQNNIYLPFVTSP